MCSTEFTGRYVPPKSADSGVNVSVLCIISFKFIFKPVVAPTNRYFLDPEKFCDNRLVSVKLLWLVVSQYIGSWLIFGLMAIFLKSVDFSLSFS
jgi:hypothetical protein